MDLKLGEKEISLRMIIKILLLVALVCFFCPYVTVSCGAEEIMGIEAVKINGVEMVTQSYAEKLQNLDSGFESSPDIALTLAVGFGVLGVFCTFSKDVNFYCIGSGIASALAALCVLLSRWTIGLWVKDWVEKNEAMVQVKFLWGWYVLFAIYLGVIILNYLQWSVIVKEE